MPPPITKGRMINRDISNSKKFAELTPPAAVLFCMLIPHYNSRGKMNGDAGYIKGEICPRIPYLTVENIPELLKEISDKTNVKWFADDGRYWIHSLNFLSEHQRLNIERIGDDKLPSFPGFTPELPFSTPKQVIPEVEVEVKKKKEKRTKKEYPEDFGRFWAEYPRQISKDVAYERFCKTAAEFPVEHLISAAKEYAEACRKEGKEEKYILHPATFLNKGRWKDFYYEEVPG